MWNHDHLQSKENLTKAQEKALDAALKKENKIKEIQREIGKILRENNLNILDLDNHRSNKKVKTFIESVLP